MNSINSVRAFPTLEYAAFLEILIKKIEAENNPNLTKFCHTCRAQREQAQFELNVLNARMGNGSSNG